MYQTIGFSQFTDEFNAVRPNNFSYDGLRVLFHHLDEYENADSEMGIELDVIAICCDFTECTIKEVLNNYDLQSLYELQENTTVLKIDDENIIYQNY